MPKVTSFSDLPHKKAIASVASIVQQCINQAKTDEEIRRELQAKLGYPRMPVVFSSPPFTPPPPTPPEPPAVAAKTRVKKLRKKPVQAPEPPPRSVLVMLHHPAGEIKILV